MIFGAKESIEVQEVTPNKNESLETEKVKLSAQKTESAAVQDVPVEDHSIRTRLARRPAAKDEAVYSDFLGKTKSVFYRIKWSLFKD